MMFLKMTVDGCSTIISSGEYRECYEAFMISLRSIQYLSGLQGKMPTANVEKMALYIGSTTIKWEVIER